MTPWSVALLMAGASVLFALGLTLAETLVWFRCWRSGHGLPRPSDLSGKARPRPSRAIIFLPGISDYADAGLLPEQSWLLEELRRRFPDTPVVGGYLPAGRTATQRYAAMDLWRRLRMVSPPLWVCGLHNLWQLLLASWWERGYGAAVAQSIGERLCAEGGLEPGSVLVLIGASAGAQVALAAAPMLQRHRGARIVVISLGGVFGSPHGMGAVAHAVDLRGARDGWAAFGSGLFPGRYWPGSHYRRLLHSGHMRQHSTGRHRHFGAGSYLSRRALSASVKTCAEQTRDVLLGLPLWQELGFIPALGTG